MIITVEAIYEAGVLKVLGPLPALSDRTRVRLTIEPEPAGALHRAVRADEMLAANLLEAATLRDGDFDRRLFELHQQQIENGLFRLIERQADHLDDAVVAAKVDGAVGFHRIKTGDRLIGQ